MTECLGNGGKKRAERGKRKSTNFSERGKEKESWREWEVERSISSESMNARERKRVRERVFTVWKPTTKSRQEEGERGALPDFNNIT